jgi:hypothetical protein
VRRATVRVMAPPPTAIVEGAAAARESSAFRAAHRLAVWVGEARRVTPRHVLRPAEVPAAARALGIPVPERVRTAADVLPCIVCGGSP